MRICSRSEIYGTTRVETPPKKEGQAQSLGKYVKL
ncbi:hypothetical protein BACCAP_04712 [Pseudoflavonifractor capillosus ATCC 29799]|uniref:Uncharacterized protein n=1 Tax=Pseudoflavonifractor capillosus ATCC 29799 TaxID=411467 RepID=A6P2I1_9FIRM|nr:hypothetical protein BACCAP_04712 [Pseudoflavonifractor capillosus ATCC 29799]